MSVVYKYLSPDLKECYVGSTINEYDRKRMHKGMKHTCSSIQLFEKYGYDNCSYVILEICPFEEQRMKEQWWLDHAVGAVNQNKAFQTEEQLLEEKRIYDKTYRENHKEKVKAYQKDYHKAYHETHKEELKAYRKSYKEAHKEELKASKKAYYERKKTTEIIAVK
jgi:hypothetical protein